MRTVLLCLAAIFVLGGFYFMIDQKERQRRDGTPIYLALAPKDPRSLLQGDYMALNYQVGNDLNHQQNDNSNQSIPTSGTMVISLDAQNVGHFVRVHQNEPLGPQEHLLHYHHENSWTTTIGADSYFIPEGTGDTFANATYGELRVAPDGTPLLVALCDKQLQPISGAGNPSR